MVGLPQAASFDEEVFIRFSKNMLTVRSGSYLGLILPFSIQQHVL